MKICKLCNNTGWKVYWGMSLINQDTNSDDVKDHRTVRHTMCLCNKGVALHYPGLLRKKQDGSDE